MCDKEDIKRSLTSLIGLKGHDITPKNFAVKIEPMIDDFFSVLGDMPVEVLEAATLHYKSTATWFPTPGAIRASAIELQMLAMGVPEPGEAWAEVLSPVVGMVSALCDEGIRLMEDCEEKIGSDYARAARLYGEHKDECQMCQKGGFKKVYSHPAIAQTVDRLGGRSNILTTTGMEGADRARFQDAYKAIIAKEKILGGMPQKVRGYIEGKQQTFLESKSNRAIGMLSERMSK